MGLSETRKLLSAINAVFTAIAIVAMIISGTLGALISSETFLEKIMITDELVSQCDSQLDKKFTVLEAETGIPFRVFEQSKEDYNIERTLKLALQKLYGGEDPTLYNNNIVEYFERLCTEFLDDSGLKYNKADIKRTAEKAAVIYCDTVGFHGSDFSVNRVRAIKNTCSKIGLTALMILLVGMLITAIIYSEKNKGIIYVLSGVTAGGIGTALSGILCFAFGVWKKIALYPDVFAEAVGNAVKICIGVTIPVGLVIAAAAFIIMFLMQRKIDNNSKRAIVV